MLIVSLVPFGVTFALRQLSARMTRKQVGSRVSASLDQNARTTLRQLFDQYNQILRREQLLMDALIRHQAREVQLRLNDSGAMASSLKEMGEVYSEINDLSPSGFERQSTVLADGTGQVYPAPNLDGKAYDFSEQPWFLQANQETGIVRVGPHMDVISNEPLYTIALAIRDDHGHVQGVTAMHRTLPSLFSNVVLPEQWADGAETMAVVVDPNTREAVPPLIVMMHPDYMESSAKNGTFEHIRLQLDDTEASRAMILDMQTKPSSVHRLPYKGRDALWAHGAQLESGVIPLVIVPYDRVTELVTTVESFILGKSIFWWQVGGAVLLVIFVSVILVGVMRAKAITQPIGVLSEASTQLAAGDYNTHIQIETGDELQTLGEAFNAIGPHLQDRERMKRSLEIAGAIQKNLLPREKPNLANFDIAGQCVYCDQTGGDYYDFISLEDQHPGTLGVALGDVTGHGIGAALLMAAARGVFRHSAREFGDRLPDLFAHCNEQLALDSDDDKFITLFYGILDSKDRSLVWASGGHDPAIWYHVKTDTMEELPNTGPPVGLFEGLAFEQLGPVYLEPGDILVVGTDGIWEAENVDNEVFGRERLMSLIRKNQDLASEALCGCITDAVLQFVAPSSPVDDVTLVVIRSC